MKIFVQRDGENTEEFVFKFALGQKVKVLGAGNFSPMIVTQHAFGIRLDIPEHLFEGYVCLDVDGRLYTYDAFQLEAMEGKPDA